MSIFTKIFGESNDEKNQPQIEWNDLKDIGQLQTIVEESFSTPVIIFKHSTRCSISRMALKQFESHYTEVDAQAKAYFLDLLSHRDISNKIAELFNVAHQSPQLLLIQDGICNYTTSHSEIDAEQLEERILGKQS